jgi:hypothetical protein
LTSEQKKYVEAQIGLLETDLSTAQKNADAIKQAMTDPDLAMTYAQAGITLNDSPQQVNEKLANYAYTKEVSNTSNKMSLNGYTFLAPGQSVPAGYEVVETTDSKGNVKRWYKKSSVSGGSEEIDIPKADIQTTLFNVGIPTAVSTSKGELNKSYYDKAIKAGLIPEVINGLWNNIIAGNTFEEIREGIKSEGGDPAILDIFVQVLQGKTKTSTNVDDFDQF